MAEDHMNLLKQSGFAMKRIRPSPFLQFEGNTSPKAGLLETGAQGVNQAYKVTGTGNPSVQHIASLSGYSFASNSAATWNVRPFSLNMRGYRCDQ
jgi:hypothetical protein